MRSIVLVLFSLLCFFPVFAGEALDSQWIVRPDSRLCVNTVEIDGTRIDTKEPGCNEPRAVQHIDDVLEIEEPSSEDLVSSELIEENHLRLVTFGCYDKGDLYLNTYIINVSFNGEKRQALYKVSHHDVDKYCDLGQHR